MAKRYSFQEDEDLNDRVRKIMESLSRTSLGHASSGTSDRTSSNQSRVQYRSTTQRQPHITFETDSHLQGERRHPSRPKRKDKLTTAETQESNIKVDPESRPIRRPHHKSGELERRKRTGPGTGSHKSFQSKGSHGHTQPESQEDGNSDLQHTKKPAYKGRRQRTDSPFKRGNFASTPATQPHSQEGEELRAQDYTRHRGQPNSRERHGGKGKDRGYVQQKEHWNIPALSIGELKCLCKLEATDLVSQLHQRIKAFQRFLSIPNKLEHVNIMDAIIYILQKISQCLKVHVGYVAHTQSDACQILGEVLSSRCAPFHVRLNVYVKRDLHTTVVTSKQYSPLIPLALCSQEAKVACISNLFKNLLETLPETSWMVLPVAELARFINDSTTLDQFMSTAETILMLHHEMRERSQKQAIEEQTMGQNTDGDWDNAEYRELQILPKFEDVCISDPPARLRANIVNGCYTDWMHYYDVQFRLLREDFIAPLRRGVCDYIQGARGRKLQDVKVYQNVRIFKPHLNKDGVSYEISFDVSRLKRCKWEHSKRLIFGSLVCLSPDNFTRTVYFATVSDREPEKLRKGQLRVQFEEGAHMVVFCREECKVRFTMVESLAYFEASRHILRSLQTAEVATMPFTQYLIENKCDDVSPPKYLTDEECVEYDLTCLLEKKSNIAEPLSRYRYLSSVQQPRQLCFNILDNDQWPSHDDVELDRSQLQAIQMALTQEIAVIQGPPGTGKTYVGLKIVDALLKNRDKWDPKKESPIVVMCYTNHALDQFLEGILQQQSVDTSTGTRSGYEDLLHHMHDKEPKIVRIGKRSKSEIIQKFNIENVRRSVHVPSVIFGEMKDRQSLVENTAGKIIGRRLKKRAHFEKSFLNLNQLLSEPQIISQQHIYQLFARAESPQENDNVLELWLGMCEVYYEQIETSSEATNTQNQGQISVSSVNQKDESKVKETMTQKEVEKEKESVAGENEHSSGEDSESEELIDIQGEARIEQEARKIGEDDDVEFEQDFQDISEDQIKNQNFVFRDPTYSDSDSDSDSELVPGFDSHSNVKAKSERMVSYIQVRRVYERPDSQNIVEWGLNLQLMSENEARNVKHIDQLSFDRRWKLYNYWVSEYLKRFRDQLEVEFEEYTRLCRESLEARRQADRFSLETAEVIGMTTTGAAKYQHILHLVKPRIVIVEEAAEVLESHIVSALNAGTQHLILIGDHKQLRPKPNEYHLAKKYNLDISLFERLVRNNFPHATLLIQHRMRPEIAQLVKPHIYSTLLNHSTVEEYDDVTGVERNLFFIQHEFSETEDENLLSHSNQHEARYLAALCKYLLQQGYKPSQITILVTYSGQLLKMRSEMPKKDFEGVRVCTVDNFQGEENDIILLSLVRSNSENRIGFLREENRVCVALSRAKNGFYCIGNIRMLRENARIWERIMADMAKKGYLGAGLPIVCSIHHSSKFTAINPEDFIKNSPEGGCLLDCDYRLSCGHVCIRKCHTSDRTHEDYTCKKPCTRKCPEGHPCPELCYVECKCMVRVTRVMPDCGHEQAMYCHESPSSVKCMNPCDTVCPNGHRCPKYCYEYCGECGIVVERVMPLCGHTQSMYCYQDVTTFDCKADCEKTCKNGHPCTKLCSERCVCEVPMEKTIAKCGHTIVLPCYKPALHMYCTKPCEKLLSCGHQCRNRCGEVCSSTLSCKVEVERILDCEHTITVPCMYRRSSFFGTVCNKPCDKILHCGHKCSKMCKEPCVTQCQVVVNKYWPCGHKLKRKCYQTENPDLFPCEKKCTNTLECGHQCPGKCSDVCAKQKCRVFVDKTYPCGHQYKIPCSSTPADHPCQMRCSFTLACGHRCEGECSRCFSTRFHQPCKYGMELKHICGHTIQAQCLDLVQSHPKKCIALCPHKKCSHSCSTQCTPCTEPCQWSCPHQRCRNACHETCDRPPCNERCENRLKCGHQCFGVCGEPCLSVCPDCQRKAFNKMFVATKTREFDRQALYIQLPCNHIFTVEYMDVCTTQPHGKDRLGYTPFAPLQCPKCMYPLYSSYRYGNAVKISLKHVNAVRAMYESSSGQVSVTTRIQLRLRSLLDGHMVKTTLPAKPSKKRGRNRKLPVTGMQFIPLPQISSQLTKIQAELSRQRRVTRQEMYILQLIVDAIELLNITSTYNLKPVSLTEINYTRNISAQLSTYINYLLWVRNDMRSRLTTQMLQDLQSERYRLCLLTQYCLVCAIEPLVKDGNPDPLYEEKHFLQQCAESNLVQVNRENFKKYARSFERRYAQLQPGNRMPVDYEAVAHAEVVTCPPVLKGNWRRCSRGHYFCEPLTMNDSTQCVCPQCPT